MKFEKRGLWTEVELFNVRWRVIQSGLDRLIPIRALTACKQMSRDRTSWNWCDRRKALNWVSRFAILFYLIYLRTTQMYACIINLSFKCSYIKFYSCQKQTMGFFLQKRKPLQRSIFGEFEFSVMFNDFTAWPEGFICCSLNCRWENIPHNGFWNMHYMHFLLPDFHRL